MIQQRIDVFTVCRNFNVKAFFGQNSRTDALSMRAVIGQENARGQFVFFLGSFCFFCFFVGSIVPLETKGASAGAGVVAAAAAAGLGSPSAGAAVAGAVGVPSAGGAAAGFTARAS